MRLYSIIRSRYIAEAYDDNISPDQYRNSMGRDFKKSEKLKTLVDSLVDVYKDIISHFSAREAAMNYLSDNYEADEIRQLYSALEKQYDIWSHQVTQQGRFNMGSDKKRANESLIYENNSEAVRGAPANIKRTAMGDPSGKKQRVKINFKGGKFTTKYGTLDDIKLSDIKDVYGSYRKDAETGRYKYDISKEKKVFDVRVGDYVMIEAPGLDLSGPYVYRGRTGYKNIQDYTNNVYSSKELSPEDSVLAFSDGDDVFFTDEKDTRIYKEASRSKPEGRVVANFSQIPSNIEWYRTMISKHGPIIREYLRVLRLVYGNSYVEQFNPLRLSKEDMSSGPMLLSMLFSRRQFLKDYMKNSGVEISRQDRQFLSYNANKARKAVVSSLMAEAELRKKITGRETKLTYQDYEDYLDDENENENLRKEQEAKTRKDSERLSSSAQERANLKIKQIKLISEKFIDYILSANRNDRLDISKRFKEASDRIVRREESGEDTGNEIMKLVDHFKLRYKLNSRR